MPSMPRQSSPLESAVPVSRVLRWLMGFRRRRRERLRAAPFPPHWQAILDQRLGLWKRLRADDRRELLGHTLVFLAEKRFEGCAGLAITDEMRVLIATQACVLLLHREADYFPSLRSILVYPDEYVVRAPEAQDDGIVIEDDEPRAGESWGEGSLVLSWQDVLAGAADADDGENVVLHEFAHQIDEQFRLSQLDAASARTAEAKQWATVFNETFDRFVAQTRRGRVTPIDNYGATNPAEFFAVVTESFFERPAELRVYAPDLYAQWSQFFRQDPISWRLARD